MVSCKCNMSVAKTVEHAAMTVYIFHRVISCSISPCYEVGTPSFRHIVNADCHQELITLFISLLHETG